MLNAKCNIHYVPAQSIMSPTEFKRPLLLSNRGLVPVWPCFNIHFLLRIMTHFLNCKYGPSLTTNLLCQPVYIIVYWSQTTAGMAAVWNNIHLISPPTIRDELRTQVNCFPVLQSKALDTYAGVSWFMPTVSENAYADCILSGQHSAQHSQ